MCEIDEIHNFEYQLGIGYQEQKDQENLLTRNNYIPPSKPVKLTSPQIGEVTLDPKTMELKTSILEKGVKK